MKIIPSIVMSLLGTSLLLSVPAQAGTIEITYNFTGIVFTAPPVMDGLLLHLQASSTGSVDQFDTLVNAVWNSVRFDTTDTLDLSTGLDNGTFTWTFANGEMLSGLLFEDDTMVDPTTIMGTFIQTLTFTGGTGEFAGVTGSSSGDGPVAPTGSAVSGRGNLTAPGLIAAVPEPFTLSIFSAGLVGAAVMRRRKMKLA